MYAKILVPMDGSEPSKHALKAAMESASKWGSELLILSVVPPIPALLYAGEEATLMESLDVYDNELKRIHNKIVDDAKKIVAANHPELKVSVSVLEGHVSSMILEVSERDDIDLIVMGSRGLSGIKRWYLGSVSRNVVEHCKKPILIMK